MFLSHHLNNAITPVIGFAAKLPADHPLRAAIEEAYRRIEAVLSVTRVASREP